MGLVSAFDSLDQGPQAMVLVAAFGALFLAMEFSMTHTPVARGIAKLLRQNEKLSEEQVERCVPMVVTRLVGFIHNAVQVPIAVWAITNPELRADRFYATHPLTNWMLCAAGGFFLHDAVSCLLRESPFYIIHGLTCCLGYTLGTAYGVCHFYGGLFLMWEVSTPFVQLRWVLHKMGRADSALYKINGILMVITFGVARILFGTYFTLLLLVDTWNELTTDKSAAAAAAINAAAGTLDAAGVADSTEALKTLDGSDAAAVAGGAAPRGDVPAVIWLGFCAAALTISGLNYYWFSLMLRTLLKIVKKKDSWGSASDDKRVKEH